jgi:hypothetical protein
MGHANLFYIHSMTIGFGCMEPLSAYVLATELGQMGCEPLKTQKKKRERGHNSKNLGSTSDLAGS